MPHDSFVHASANVQALGLKFELHSYKWENACDEMGKGRGKWEIDTVLNRPKTKKATSLPIFLARNTIPPRHEHETLCLMHRDKATQRDDEYTDRSAVAVGCVCRLRTAT